MSDITEDNLELPWTTAPTDGETAAEILALAGTTEVVVQTEEDLGPKDTDLPTIH